MKAKSIVNLDEVGSPPGGDPDKRSFNYRGKLGPVLDYWEGE